MAAPNLPANSASLSSHEERLRRTRDEWNLSGPVRPLFAFTTDAIAPASRTRQVGLTGATAASGTRELVLPFRILGANYESPRLIPVSAPDWLLDLNLGGINLGTGTGGRLDPTVGLTSITDYLIWAFMDKEVGGVFAGIGVTPVPFVAGAAVFNGALGSLTSFTMGGGASRRFRVGGRIIGRVSAALGAAFNQGTIVAVTASKIDVLMDAAYVGVTQANAALPATVDVEQVTGFHPGISGKPFTYPGDSAYPYCYLGRLQTDAGSDIRLAQAAGEFRWFSGGPIIIYSASIGAPPGGSTVDTRVCLARWVPYRTPQTMAQLAISRVAGASAPNALTAAVDAALVGAFSTGDSSGTAAVRETSLLPIRSRDCSILLRQMTASASTSLGVGTITGYQPDVEI